MKLLLGADCVTEKGEPGSQCLVHFFNRLSQPARAAFEDSALFVIPMPYIDLSFQTTILPEY